MKRFISCSLAAAALAVTSLTAHSASAQTVVRYGSSPVYNGGRTYQVVPSYRSGTVYRSGRPAVVRRGVGTVVPGTVVPGTVVPGNGVVRSRAFVPAQPYQSFRPGIGNGYYGNNVYGNGIYGNGFYGNGFVTPGQVRGAVIGGAIGNSVGGVRGGNLGAAIGSAIGR